MKTILVLTDLSKNSLNASEAALIIAVQTHANLVLFHSCIDIPMLAYYPGMPWINEDQNWLDESGKQLKSLARHLRNFGQRMYPDEEMPSIHYEVGQGEIAANIQNIIDANKAALIVMGGRTGSQMEHLAFGSDTNSMLNYCTKPILIVAQKKPLRKVNKITFATNFKEEDISAIKLLLKYRKQCQYELDIVHVKLFGADEKTLNTPVTSFIETLAEENYPVVKFKEVWGKDLIRRLYTLCAETETDVLALTHQQHSFFVNILKEGIVKKSIISQQLPLLILPS
nr:universal stress protein [Pedobacter sp. ASV19]